MRKKIRGDNNGFSLVELIVAVLILGILSGIAVAGFSSVHNARVSTAAQTVMNAMKQARTRAMGKKEATSLGSASVFVEFFEKNGYYYVDIVDDGTVISDDKICSDILKLKFSIHTDTTGSEFEPHDGSSATNYKIRFYYEKGTGAITSTALEWGGETKFGPCDNLEIEGTSETKNLIIVPVTGRCYLDE
ncbi:MAG: prepilin-type N-terminal cleavage/methylation domain-containing protein [Lachnospiraceae bacterium]|nr:prepilin-type N-terminal cleavage/methylation domain-containing protein [Lachnospiraceae bacterium]